MSKIDKKRIVFDKKLNFNFDLYTRNYYISSFINSLQVKSLNILDVGGRSGFLQEFLKSGVELSILDIRETEISEKNYIQGSITDSDIKDDSFDVVTSSDLFEHIEEKDREQALKEMFRVSKDIVIIAAPFYSPENALTETIAVDFYRKIHKVDHLWLKEHSQSQLPRRENLESYLEKNNYDYYSIGSNNINTWLLLQMFNFISYYESDIKKYYQVHNFYNSNFQKLGDSVEPCYRHIYFISKLGKLKSKPDLEEDVVESRETKDLYKLIMEALVSAFKKSEKGQDKITRLKQKEIILEKNIEEKTRELDSIYNSKFWKLVTNLRRLRGSLK